jgi:hypothetical protein
MSEKENIFKYGNKQETQETTILSLYLPTELEMLILGEGNIFREGNLEVDRF